MSHSFPYYHQLDAMDCGPTCLRMVAMHYGRHYSLETLRQKCFIGRSGVSMLGISKAAESIGLQDPFVRMRPRTYSTPKADCKNTKKYGSRAVTKASAWCRRPCGKEGMIV